MRPCLKRSAQPQTTNRPARAILENSLPASFSAQGGRYGERNTKGVFKCSWVITSFPLLSLCSRPILSSRTTIEFLTISAPTLEKRQTIFWKRFPWRTESSTGQTKDMALQKKETDSCAHALTI